MVQAVNRDAYRSQLHALLPNGPAWPEESDTTLDAFVRAVAADIAEADRSAANLLTEILPNTTFDLLPDWERVLGLPDSCSVATSDVTTRRASVLALLVAQPTLHPDDYVAIGERFGVTVTVDDLNQTRAQTWAAAQNPVVDVSGGRWRHVWFIDIPASADARTFRVNSRVNERLATFFRNTELECRLQKAAPAHSHLQIAYVTAMTQPVQFRFDSIADLQAFAGGVALGSADGLWEEQASGSTDSGNTGPANNSGGPYVATDASGGSFAEIRDNSELQLSVVDQWPAATNRVLRLRLVLAGAWTLAGNGLQVQGLDGGGAWEDIQLIRGWSYDSTVDAGDTFNDDDGVQRTAALDGGWVDYDIAIADRFDDVRMRLVATGGSTTQKDLALWSAELRNT